MIRVETEFPYAVDSLDHTHPLGAKNDCSRWRPFNEKLIEMIPGVTVLDLGCAGGGMVADFVRDGYLAVGIDGASYPVENQSGEWSVFGGKHLFSADITKWFDVIADGRPINFEVVTAWEVMEHIEVEDLSDLFENIKQHLVPGGLFIGSISTGIQRHHVTVRPESWWRAVFEMHGFAPRHDLERYIDPDWLRGSRTGEVESFGVVFEKVLL